MTDTSVSPQPHTPVMLAEVLDALAPRDRGIYVDGTFGNGGYTRGILAAADARVVGIDRDPNAVAASQALQDEMPGRVMVVMGCFGNMDTLVPPALAEWGALVPDGIALDLGVSSMQLDQAERGFSFRHDGPLDMRMDAGAGDAPSAADVVNSYEPRDLAQIFRVLGEERHAKRVAQAIVRRRDETPFVRTADLADTVARAIGGKPQRIHPATRVFQALRMYVNDELGELARGLIAAEKLLAEGGRLAVVSFHSLEDRVVKRFFASRSGAVSNPSRHLPEAQSGPAPSFRLITRKAREPGEVEINTNPRARSARLRAVERTSAPVHAVDASEAGMAALGLPRMMAGALGAGGAA
ncbi:16S rRNA (cytosine(1402)-N(4))-methyltransferase RsmH [Pyruvatibacter sp.]|uniref:16S rRNA (cytosine(1402)-N(4))-methyltransferase RsmH n=1 Tax=Pyruvatibacter sp. TaxID=1981328 RepID=UPI0032EDE240